MLYHLSSIEKTQEFAGIFGSYIVSCYKNNKIYPQTLYLLGDLGLGKTTFTSAFVSVFPGAEEAEVGSPSFTLCNEYPTEPEIYHADLYRLPDNAFLPEELQDLPKKSLLLIEWAERLTKEEQEADALCLRFSFDDEINSENTQKKCAEKLDNFDNSCEKKRRVEIFSAHARWEEFLQGLALALQDFSADK